MIITGGTVCPKRHGTGIDPPTSHNSNLYLFVSRPPLKKEAQINNLHTLFVNLLRAPQMILATR